MHTPTHPFPSFLPRFTPTSSKALARGIFPCAGSGGQNSLWGWPGRGLGGTTEPLCSVLLPACVLCQRTVQKLLTVSGFPT